MSDPHQDTWSAFFLSLAVPGAGQLRARSPTCLAFFAAAAALAMAPGPRWLRWLPGLAVALLSAEHARRLAGPPGRHPRGARPRTAVLDRPAPGRGIDLLILVDLDRPHAEVWPLVADLPRFVTIDPFHSRLIVQGPALRPGVDLVLEHRAFGLHLRRFGRLLAWRDGVGYTFSDLAAGGPRGFFPHVFTFAVEPTAPGRCRLSVRVRGRWTWRWVPRGLGRLWFGYVCREHARLLARALA